MNKFEGFDSDWSEGTFKMMRLHDIQNLINHYKSYMTLRSENRFNFEHWYQQILNLRDEGDSKYNSDEKKSCDAMELEIENILSNNPPFRLVNEGRMGQVITKYQLFKEPLQHLLKLIRKYEQFVKYLNDTHGLTTKNRDYDMDGL